MRTLHKPTGWNTWDFQGFNRLVYLRGGDTVVTVQFAIWDETVPARVPPPDPEHRKIGKLYQQFRWEDVTKLGPHAPLGLPARLEFKAGDVPYVAEALDKGGTLHLTVTPLRESRQRVVFLFLAPVGQTPDCPSPRRGTFAGCAVEFTGATWPTNYFVNISSTIERKVKALYQHQSQIKNDWAEKWVWQRARECARGKEMDYAEGFRVITLVDDDSWEKIHGSARGD